MASIDPTCKNAILAASFEPTSKIAVLAAHMNGEVDRNYQTAKRKEYSFLGYLMEQLEDENRDESKVKLTVKLAKHEMNKATRPAFSDYAAAHLAWYEAAFDVGLKTDAEHLEKLRANLKQCQDDVEETDIEEARYVKQRAATKKIQAAYLRAMWNPSYKMCRARLTKEYEAMTV